MDLVLKKYSKYFLFLLFNVISFLILNTGLHLSTNFSLGYLCLFNIICFKLITYRYEKIINIKPVLYVTIICILFLELNLIKFGEMLFFKNNVILNYLIIIIGGFCYYKAYERHQYNNQKQKDSKTLYLIIALFTLIYLFLLSFKTNIFWDSGVYIAIGKYFFGGNGLYESFRPPLYPILIGIFWKIGFNAIVVSKIIIFFASILAIVSFNKISLYFLKEEESYYWTLIFITIPSFIFYSTQGLNDILSLALVLFCFLLLFRKQFWFAGIVAGMSFLTRFNNGIIIISIALFVLFEKESFSKKISNTLKLAIPFIIIVGPYLLYNYNLYHNPMQFLIDGSKIIKHVGLSIHEPWWYYFAGLLFENIFLIIFCMGIYVVFKKTKLNHNFNYNLHYSLISFAVLSFLYLSSLARKEMRYSLAFTPILLIYCAIAISKIKDNKKIAIIVFVLFVGVIQAQIGYYTYNTMFISEIPTDLYNDFYQTELRDTVVFSSPVYLAYYDINSSVIYDVKDWISINSNSRFKYYLINTCDLFCVTGDNICESIEQEFIHNLTNSYNEKFFKETEYCKYYVFEEMD